jgi:hypothetical protein
MPVSLTNLTYLACIAFLLLFVFYLWYTCDRIVNINVNMLMTGL